jgi:tetratricopeptide (TPR) repeat protein
MIARTEKAAARALAAGDGGTAGALLANAGLVHKAAGRSDAAHDAMSRAVALLREADGLHDLAEALTNLGFLERDLGRPDEARARYEEARAIFARLRDDIGVGRALVELAILDKDHGGLTEARAGFEEGLALLPADGEPRQRAHALTGLALTFELLNDFSAVASRYRTALRLYRRAGDRQGEALVLHNVGQILSSCGKLARARDRFLQSLAVNDELGDEPGVVENLTALAGLLQAHGATEQARQLHLAALRRQRRIGDRRGQIWTLCDLGIIARDARRMKEAERRFTSALAITAGLDTPQEVYEIRFLRGDARLIAGRVDEAIQDYEAAAAAAESLRATLLVEAEAVAYFNEERLEAYERLVRVYFGLGRTWEALTWAERARSRELIRRLSVAPFRGPHGAPASTIEREAALLRRPREAATAVSGVAPAGRREAIRVREELEREVRATWEELAVYDPHYAALRRARGPSPEELKACLSPN